LAKASGNIALATSIFGFLEAFPGVVGVFVCVFIRGTLPQVNWGISAKIDVL
jgi:hypothetical protein